MYRPLPFREDRPEVLRAAIQAHPLGTIVTWGPSGLTASLLPFSLVSTPDGHVLRAHLSKKNQQLADLREQAPTLVLFQGPHSYIRPNWYASKREHGKVVPTWNYVVVQVRGTPRVIDDRSWLMDHVSELTDAQEGNRTDPWKTTDAPASFVNAQLAGIAGIELPMTCVEGKWKLSQNQSIKNQVGVVDALGRSGSREIAELMKDKLVIDRMD